MNVNEMSCEQVNEEIAQLRPNDREVAILRPRYGTGIITVGLDYCHDSPAAEVLQDEMVVTFDLQQLGEWINSFRLRLHIKTNEAIARAWLQWKKEAAE
jgi:hypothetical protein